MTEPNRQSEAKEERIIEIEIERLRPFKEHPFQVKDDKEMFLLQESIEKYSGGSSWMAESIASPRRVSMTGLITWNSKKQGVYDLLKKNQMEAVIVDYWKRIPKDSFRNWYKSQSRYRTKEDREKDALLEDATITMEQRDLERSMQ